MTDDTFAFEPEALEAFIKEYMELDRRVKQPRNLYSVLPGAREGQYQNTLQYFLNPRNPHGFGDAVLKPFLEQVGLQEFNLSGQHIEIDDEVPIKIPELGGRIDLIICGGSALADQPKWAVFLELKVGAEEGSNQTTNYANATEWNFSWFESDTIAVDALETTHYVYLKRRPAPKAADETGTFTNCDWAAVANRLQRELDGGLYQYPNRSVIQFTDFMDSLTETEGMDSDIDDDELNERLGLYFEYDRLIKQVEEANSQFESDFEDVSEYLRTTWEGELAAVFDVEGSNWQLDPSTNPKWQGIYPDNWEQEPVDGENSVIIYFRHAPTTDALRNRELTFRLRLPPSRNIHTNEQASGVSFNEVFTKHLAEDSEKLRAPLDDLEVDDRRLGSSSTLIEKTYQLDENHLTDSYFDRLAEAVTEFCCDDHGLLEPINDAFEEAYRTVFQAEPAGKFPGPLEKLE